MRFLDVTRWPAIVVFLMAGAMVVASAFTTVNLFTEAMANAAFVRSHGLMALREGALVQLAGLVVWGLLALAAFLIFKACETELLARYRAWTARRK